MNEKRLTPNETVRALCIECLGLPQYNRSEIENCKGDTCIGGCALFPYRLGKRIPVKVFRKFCSECMNRQPALIPECPATKCKIFPYRMGKNPVIKWSPSPERRREAAERMKRVRSQCCTPELSPDENFSEDACANVS